MMEGVLAGLSLALLAAALWGCADFCAQQASRRVGFWGALFGVNLAGGILFACLPAARQLGQLAHPALWVAIAATNTVAGALFYFALEHGRLALVSPLVAAFPVVAVALALTVGGERLSAPAAFAVAAVILGSVLAGGGQGSAPEHPREPAALVAGGASALLYGGVFYELGIHASAGAVAPVLVFRITGAIAVAGVILLRGMSPLPALRCPSAWLAGVLDTSAFGTYMLAARRLPVALVSPLGSLFTLFSLLLAVVLLHERIGPRRWVGIGCIVAGLGLIAVK